MAFIAGLPEPGNSSGQSVFPKTFSTINQRELSRYKCFPELFFLFSMLLSVSFSTESNIKAMTIEGVIISLTIT